MRYLFVTLFTFLVSTGCSVFQKQEYRHYESCGPDALSHATYRLGLHISEIQVSKEIINNNKCYSLLRDFLSMFDREAKEITFPAEIKNYLKKKNIKITHISPEKLESLSPEETAIVLVRKKGTLTFHWACFPVTKNLSSFFGEGATSVIEVILLEKL